MSSVSSSSLVSSSFWSWASVVYVVCSCVVGWVVVVVLADVVGCAGCLSLLFMKSLSIAFQFEVSSAVVSQIMPPARLLLSPLVLSDCELVLRSSSHLLIGLPCLLRLFFAPTPLVSCLPTSECVSPVVAKCLFGKSLCASKTRDALSAPIVFDTAFFTVRQFSVAFVQDISRWSQHPMFITKWCGHGCSLTVTTAIRSITSTPMRRPFPHHLWTHEEPGRKHHCVDMDVVLKESHHCLELIVNICQCHIFLR